MADSRSRSRSPRKAASTSEQAVVESVFRGLWQLLQGIIGLFRSRDDRSVKTGSGLSVKELREHWEEVELHILQDATHTLAVSEADKIFAAALEARGISGTSLGEQLKKATKLFPPELYQSLWEAHKLRNRLAHEVGVEVSGRDARDAVSSFRQGLYQLKILL